MSTIKVLSKTLTYNGSTKDLTLKLDCENGATITAVDAEADGSLDFIRVQGADDSSYLIVRSEDKNFESEEKIVSEGTYFVLENLLKLHSVKRAKQILIQGQAAAEELTKNANPLPKDGWDYNKQSSTSGSLTAEAEGSCNSLALYFSEGNFKVTLQDTNTSSLAAALLAFNLSSDVTKDTENALLGLIKALCPK